MIRVVCGLVILWTFVAIVETAGGQILPRDFGHEQLPAPIAAVAAR